MPPNFPNNRQDNNQNVNVYNYPKNGYRSDLFDSTTHILKFAVQSILEQKKDRFVQGRVSAKTDRNTTNLPQESRKIQHIDFNMEMSKIRKEESFIKLKTNNGLKPLNLNWNERKQNSNEKSYLYQAARTDRDTRTHKISVLSNITNNTNPINNEFDLNKERLRQTVSNYNCWHFKTLNDAASVKGKNEFIKDNQQKREIQPKYGMDSLVRSDCNSRVEYPKISTPRVESTRVSQIANSFSSINYQPNPNVVANNINGIQKIIFRTHKRQYSGSVTSRASQQNIVKTLFTMEGNTQSSGISYRHRKNKSFFGRQSQEQGQNQINIDDFELGQCKGEGRFGKFFPAMHKKTGLLVGIKQVKKQSVRLMLDQFIQQIKISFFLDHPNLVKLYGYFHDISTIYLIMEYMEEGTLYKTMKLKKQLAEEETTVRLRQICEAVSYMHENDILHRDIKPQNIVLTHGVSKLCDFGWAAYSLDRRNTYCGTLDYVCPQILEGESYDHFVDIWAIGVLAFEMLVGKAPFYHISRQQTMKSIMKCDFSFPQNLTYKAKQFITKALQKNPDQRFSVDCLLEDPFLSGVAKM